MPLTNDEVINSFNAIRDFLPTNKLHSIYYLKAKIIITSEIGRHQMNDMLELELDIYNAIYTFYSNCFYHYTKLTKLRSSEYVFTWDDTNKELFTFHDKNKIAFKFISFTDDHE